jgi:type II secretory pathway pseudopilin PulG
VPRPTAPNRIQERGTSLAELMIALVVLSIGLLAVAQLFPAGSRGQLRDRMLTAANYYAQEKIEQFVNLPWTAPALDPGRHPAGTATEDLGQWKRFYQVDVLDPPLENLKRITVTVTWTFQGTRSVTATTYARR